MRVLGKVLHRIAAFTSFITSINDHTMYAVLQCSQSMGRKVKFSKLQYNSYNLSDR